MNWWNNLFTGEGFTPHGFCLFWNPDLVTLEIVGNIGVALAYFAIPLQLAWVALRGGSPIPRWVLLLFTAFILLCGISHVLDVVTLFRPLYWLHAIEVALTGLVSLATAVLVPFNRMHAARRRQHGDV